METIQYMLTIGVYPESSMTSRCFIVGERRVKRSVRQKRGSILLALPRFAIVMLISIEDIPPPSLEISWDLPTVLGVPQTQPHQMAARLGGRITDPVPRVQDRPVIDEEYITLLLWHFNGILRRHELQGVQGICLLGCEFRRVRVALVCRQASECEAREAHEREAAVINEHQWQVFDCFGGPVLRESVRVWLQGKANAASRLMWPRVSSESINHLRLHPNNVIVYLPKGRPACGAPYFSSLHDVECQDIAVVVVKRLAESR